MSKSINEHLNEQRGVTSKADKIEKFDEANSPTKGIFTSDGKKFQTYTFNDDATANSFLEKNKGYGVIGTHGETVHVARMKDTGTTSNKQSKDGKVGK